jgi:folate-binding protein YgfZ
MLQAVSAQAYAAARHQVALVDRSSRGQLLVSGRDRASYLQGLLTNDIEVLKAGQGCYALYLTAQGRMIADLYVYELGDVIFMTMVRELKGTVLTKLDQFIFSEDVQLGDVSETFRQIGFVGPWAAETVAGLLDDVSAAVLEALPEYGNVRAHTSGAAAIVTRTQDVGVPGFDVALEAAHAQELRAASAAKGLIELDAGVADVIRIEAGVPLFHRDMDEETIPLEAGLESRAISFTKGCYVGQEVVIRILHRGHGRVVRKLVGLVFGGDQVPVEGSIVTADDREIGRITSSGWSPALQRPIALAYLHRDFVETGTRVSVGELSVAAHVATLPFIQ